MASSNEKVTFGAVVNTANHNASSDENALLTPTTQSSPFYALSSAQPSLQSLPSKKEANIAIYETDLESGLQGNRNLTPFASHSALDLPAARPVASYATTQKHSIDGRPKECTMWPTKETLREKAKAQKAKEQNTKWGGSMKTKWDSMTKKQRLYIQILVILLIVALAVGLGIGISRAVGGGVWAGKGESHSIPDTS